MEKDVVMALARQLNIRYLSLEELLSKMDYGLKGIVPESFARGGRLLPLCREGRFLVAAFVDPLDLTARETLRWVTGCYVLPVLATEAELMKAIEAFYGERDPLMEAVKDSYNIDCAEGTDMGEKRFVEGLMDCANEAPVARLVDLILRKAIERRASSVHIEPYWEATHIRLRVDGLLHHIPAPARHLLPALVSRIKILAGLDIAQRRLPQDGGFSLSFEDRQVDFRVSTTPTVCGEKAVLRILDKANLMLSLEELGFEKEALEDFKRGITSPHGLILLTGPVGSGKTTTLYAALSAIKSPHKSIVTVEEPVEYRIEGVNQVQVKPEIGLTFAKALRAFLRQDPDVIMVGEIRDPETAKICLRAAVAGHLTLSTLHTSSAPKAIDRLIDMGAKPYLIASSVVMLASQRLLRKLCPHCKEVDKSNVKSLRGVKVYKASGCKWCDHTGYLGRTGIFEVILMDGRLQNLIADGAKAQRIYEVAKVMGIRGLWESGLAKVKQGVTSVEEAQSVSKERRCDNDLEGIYPIRDVDSCSDLGDSSEFGVSRLYPNCGTCAGRRGNSESKRHPRRAADVLVGARGVCG